MRRPLVVVDVQHGVCEGGSWPVTGGITVGTTNRALADLRRAGVCVG